MSKTGASPEFERKMQEIGAKYAHMMVPRSNVQRPWAEFDFPEAPPEDHQVIPEAAVEAAVNAVLAETYGADWARRIATIAVKAAAPHIISEHLSKLAADVRARGDIGKDGGLESWDYLTWHAERVLTE